MPKAGSALDDLNIDDTLLSETIDKLFDEAPDVAALMQAMQVFTNSTPAELGNLIEQTADMRRSHITILLALIDDTRSLTFEAFRNIDLDDRISDNDLLTPIIEGLNGAGAAMCDLINTLHRRKN